MFISTNQKRFLENNLREATTLETDDDILGIVKTYNKILYRFRPKIQVDSLNVVKEVEKYRQYWKPEKVKVVLLAESHVFTNEQDYCIGLKTQILEGLLPNYPSHFVRFVYCLGYGENCLLKGTTTEKRNSGTPQYWKIFNSCVAEREQDLGFNKILKKKTSFRKRLQNKISVLQEMKKKGIWLLDASIVGLYGSVKKDSLIIENIIRICWKNHISRTFAETKPKQVIVIGKGVGKILRYYLRENGIDFTIIPQPQARGSSEWQLENFRKYQRICTKYC
jgi:hypothetical protein